MRVRQESRQQWRGHGPLEPASEDAHGPCCRVGCCSEGEDGGELGSPQGGIGRHRERYCVFSRLGPSVCRLWPGWMSPRGEAPEGAGHRITLRAPVRMPRGHRGASGGSGLGTAALVTWQLLCTRFRREPSAIPQDRSQLPLGAGEACPPSCSASWAPASASALRGGGPGLHLCL